MNTETLHVPATRGRPKKEYSTSEMAIGQSPSIDLNGDIGLDTRVSESILPVETPMASDYLKELAFNEEPVTIRLERSSEKNAPNHVPAWVNGKGAEILTDDGKWLTVTYLPVGQIITTKRKYVETLVRAKPNDVQTVHEDATAEKPRNEVIRTTRAANPLTVINDKNPRGYHWLTKIMAEG